MRLKRKWLGDSNEDAKKIYKEIYKEEEWLKGVYQSKEDVNEQFGRKIIIIIKEFPLLGGGVQNRFAV